MRKYIHDLIVYKNIALNDEYFILELTHPEPLPDIFPAQFAEVSVPDKHGVFLRRPISIHDVDYDSNIVKLLIQIVGDGTKKLSQISTGSTLNLVYPLGNSFSMPSKPNLLLVGGGCGMAPLLYTARYFTSFGFSIKVLIGARTKENILLRDEYRKHAELLTCTEDGTHGTKGYVTDHPVLSEPEGIDVIYACGPTPMMKAIAKYAEKNNIECEVSLENVMACGIGACLCCVQKTIHGNKTVCNDGPVFNIKEIVW
ncbi:MAG: dihydroorotate dehydrogenase electron transfer subunit [Bacteroidales bacterium]|nr:dihydroorotate dehydrogenase electron transfer subunit [Bacteroidales bacterium]HOY38868.1 dihydroorotate dehydrogenase electron transfer subunit [Bacteroidales bacterium]HQP04730.1 dihydroorotate dehydrogenase electron transfer subunit [Bacteroidales bacterium]